MRKIKKKMRICTVKMRKNKKMRMFATLFDRASENILFLFLEKKHCAKIKNPAFL